MFSHDNTYKNKVSELVSWGHWFAFYNMLLALLLGCIYIFNSPFPTTGWGVAYLTTSWIGHFTFLIFAFYILILFPLTFLLPNQRILRFLGSVYATLFISAIFLDAMIFKYMHLHIHALVWKLLISGEEENAQTIWNALFVFVPIIFCIELWLSAYVWRRLRKLSKRRVGRKITLFFGICFLSSHIIYVLADAQLYRPVTMQRSNFPLAYPMTAKSFLEKHGWFTREEYAKQLAEQSGNYELVNYPLQPLAFSDQGKRYNLMLIMVDSLRSDMLAPSTMPNLEAFAQNNLQFSQHYSSGNDVQGGLFGLFFGLPATYDPNFRTDNKKSLLVATLKERDYELGLFSSDDFSDLFYSRSVFDSTDLPPVVATTEIVNDDAKAVHNWKTWLSEQTADDSWFSYLELKGLQNYEKQDFPEVFPVNKTPQSIEQANAALKARYKNAAHYNDQLLQQVFTTLQEKAMLENTIVIVTSNHGMEFNETGTDTWGANSNYSKYQVKVPLVMHWPEKEAAAVSERTSHMDIVPTLMESLLNTTSTSKTYSIGTNLFDVQPRPWLLAGDAKDIVVIEPKRTIVLDKFGNYHIFNEEYQTVENEQAKISVLLQVMTELKRFNVQAEEK